MTDMQSESLTELKETRDNLPAVYLDIRAAFLDLANSILADDEELTKRRRRELDSRITRFSKMAAKMLGLMFGIHGTDERRFIGMVDFYEDLNVSLQCINELIDK